MNNHKVFRYNDNNIEIEELSENGKTHRINGPAIIYYDESGKVKSKYLYKNGKYHRLDEP